MPVDDVMKSEFQKTTAPLVDIKRELALMSIGMYMSPLSAQEALKARIEGTEAIIKRFNEEQKKLYPW